MKKYGLGDVLTDRVPHNSQNLSHTRALFANKAQGSTTISQESTTIYQTTSVVSFDASESMVGPICKSGVCQASGRAVNTRTRLLLPLVAVFAGLKNDQTANWRGRTIGYIYIAFFTTDST